MEVIIINDFGIVRGGADQVAITSARALAAAGVKVRFIAASGGIDASLQGIENLTPLSLGLRNPVERGGVRGALQGIWNREAAMAVRESLMGSESSSTLLHLHGWTKVLSPSVLRVLRFSGLPVVSTLHDYVSACPNGAFFNYRRRKICKLKPLGGRCLVTQCDRQNVAHKIWRVLRQFVLRVLGGYPGHFGQFVTISSLSEKVLTPHLSPKARLHRVRNPTARMRTDPVDVAANQNFVFVGRLAFEKGAQDFALAAQSLGVPAVFVGAGEMEGEVRAACPNAHLTGWLDGNELETILRNARAVVFPSRWYEGQGMIPAEAASFGVPAVVASSSAAAEEIQDTKNGLLFRAGDIDDLSRAMRRYLDDSFAARLGRQAYLDYWGSPSTSQDHARALIKVYQDILRSGESGRGTSNTGGYLSG